MRFGLQDGLQDGFDRQQCDDPSAGPQVRRQVTGVCVCALLHCLLAAHCMPFTHFLLV
jgi:hypothetical protein